MIGPPYMPSEARVHADWHAAALVRMFGCRRRAAAITQTSHLTVSVLGNCSLHKLLLGQLGRLQPAAHAAAHSLSSVAGSMATQQSRKAVSKACRDLSAAGLTSIAVHAQADVTAAGLFRGSMRGSRSASGRCRGPIEVGCQSQVQSVVCLCLAPAVYVQSSAALCHSLGGR